ncbi:Uu.00g072000.m01.CDS01 [Anthostomella pinea]|uniref:Uu.00g072000.m01.CDS01 n=1 Tax=Anthostomella pinea TaxID=933095 RepID=A0AAI8VVM5_9PEZI|nr:Uu.00g072000.m01.CDS01 [Anthostomella pinea]
MAPPEPPQQMGAATKKKNNKKKKNAAKSKPTEEDAKATEIPQNGESRDKEGDQSDDPDAPAVNAQRDSPNGHARSTSTNGQPSAASPSKPVVEQADEPKEDTASADTSARLEAMTTERQALRAEVEELRKQLEGIQATHTQETTQLKSDLEEVEAAKEHVEEQYQTLVGRVEKIKESVGNRLARGKEELEEANQRIDELETQNEELQKGTHGFEDEIAGLKTELQDATRELSSLRSRNNLSQHNSLKEKEDMTRQIQHLREEAEAAKDAMGDWEVLAMEERSIRESLTEKTAALEEEVSTLRDSYERAASERDSQSQAVDSLQRALQEIQEARKKELREMVETSEEQLQALKKLVKEADSRASVAETAKDSLQKELERTAPYEKEVKEKNLLIGKLRHEAIVLNDHLTKALRYLKKSKPEDNIDRQIVTNHFLQFLALDRSDPKKFQILQVIAGLLNWTDEQREQAGLARPGTSNNSLRLPTSPFHRTPSTPSLNAEFFSEPTPTSAHNKESLADLWAGFLERSVDEASQAGGSRKGSMSSIATGNTRPETRGAP